MSVSGIIKFAPLIAPLVVGKIIEVGTTHPKIGKIVMGAGLIGSGVYMMVSSGLPKLIGSYLKVIDNSQPTKQVMKPYTDLRNAPKGNMKVTQTSQSEKAVTHWGTALVGFAATTLGIYTIASAFMSVDIPENNNFEGIKTCEDTLAIGKKAISQCKAANDLWNDVKVQGDFTVQCLQPNTENVPSHTITETRSIYLSGVNNDGSTVNGSGRFGDLIWELSNLKNSACFKSVLSKMCQYPDEITFAGEVEKCEYKSYSNCLDVVKKCAKEAKWTSNITFNKLTLQEYIYSQMQNGHTLSYFVEWYRFCTPEKLQSNIEKLKLMAESAGFDLPYNINTFN